MRTIQSVALIGSVASCIMILGHTNPARTATPTTVEKSVRATKAMPDAQVIKRNAPSSANTPSKVMHEQPCFQPETPADIQQRASCVIQVDGGLMDLSASHVSGAVICKAGLGSRFDATTAALLLSTTALSEPVVQSVFDQKPGLVGQQVLIATKSSDSRFVLLEVSLKKAEKPWPDNAANLLLDALVKQLRTAAEESQKAEKAVLVSRLAVINKKLDASEKRYKEICDSRKRVEAALGPKIGYVRDPISIIKNVKRKISSLESQLEQSKTRLAKLEFEPYAQYESDVKSAEKTLSQLTENAKHGKATSEEITDAATKLVKAKERLAAAREAEKSSRHNRHSKILEAGNLRSTIASLEKRLAPLKEQLETLESPDISTKLANYRNYEKEERELQNEIWMFKKNIRTMQQAIDENTPLTFTVLNGHPASEGMK